MHSLNFGIVVKNHFTKVLNFAIRVQRIAPTIASARLSCYRARILLSSSQRYQQPAASTAQPDMTQVPQQLVMHEWLLNLPAFHALRADT